MLEWRRRWSHSLTCVPKLFWGPADRSRPSGGIKSGLEAPGANALSSPAFGDHRHTKVSPHVKSYSTRRSSQVCSCLSLSRHSSWRLPKTFAQRIAKKKPKEKWNGGLKISVFYSAHCKKQRNRGWPGWRAWWLFDYIWRLWRQWICALLHSLDFTLIQTFISEPNFPPTPVKAVRHIRTTSTIPGGKPNWRFYACNMYWWYYIMYYHNKYYYYVFLLNHDKFV